MSAVQGQASATSGGSEYNALAFLVQQLVGRLNTATLVKVLACTNAGGVAPSGTVDIQLLVNQVDGSGNAVANAQVFTVPYFRLQGGANAIIVDPQPGDIGIAVFADHDVSRVKATKAAANPGSRRRFALGDALYLGGLLNGTPTQYVQFIGSDMHVTSTTGKIVLTDKAGSTVVMNGDHSATMTFSTGLTVNADVTVNGWVTASGEGTFNGGHTVSQHRHAQGTDTHGDTEQDVNTPYG